MWERLSRFNTQPGDIKIALPVFRVTKVQQPNARWLVRMVIEFEGSTWPVEDRVWAYSSTDAAARAEENFYAGLGRQAREQLPLRVVAVLQEAV